MNNNNNSYNQRSLKRILLLTFTIVFFYLIISLLFSSDKQVLDKRYHSHHSYSPVKKNQHEELLPLAADNNEYQQLNHKVAVAALLTQNSARGEKMSRAIDGLAVLRRSMLELIPAHNHRSFSFVAILTHSVDEKWERVLKENLGWTVIKRYDSPPVDPATEIKNKQIAREIVNDGAIGVDELTKLRAFEWGNEYDLVMLMDADILFHHPFPELYEKLSGKALRWTKGGWASEKINGGFLIIEPKGDVGKLHFKNMIDAVKEGDFRSGSGWRGSGIGWTYGGRTVQGILPYYFLHYLKRKDEQKTVHELGHIPYQLRAISGGNNVKNHDDPAQVRSGEDTNSSSSSSFRYLEEDDIQLNRCKYNNMDQLPECKALPIEEVTSNHFTGDCVKPWWCVQTRTPRCGTWVKRWKQVYARELRAQGVLLQTAYRLENAPGLNCEFESLAKHWYDQQH